MPKPTQAEVTELIVRLRDFADDDDLFKAPQRVMDRADGMREAADALEALAGEGAERPEIRRALAIAHQVNLFYQVCSSATAAQILDAADREIAAQSHADMTPLYAAPPAKPAGELPPLPYPDLSAGEVHPIHGYSGDQMRVYAMRALRERA